jgi:hypothetical protein
VDQKVALLMDPMLCWGTSGLWTSDVPLARYILLQFSLTGRNAQFELISKFLYKPSPLTVQLHNVEISYATQVFFKYTPSQSSTKCTDLQLPSFWWSEISLLSEWFLFRALNSVGSFVYEPS